CLKLFLMTCKFYLLVMRINYRLLDLVKYWQTLYKAASFHQVACVMFIDEKKDEKSFNSPIILNIIRVRQINCKMIMILALFHVIIIKSLMLFRKLLTKQLKKI